MPKTAARYELTGICLGGRTVHGVHKHGAPSAGQLCTWGKAKGAAFVMRYYPSKRGWRLLDIRKAIQAGGNSSPRFWVGMVTGERIYPSMDAAIMHAIAILNR